MFTVIGRTYQRMGLHAKALPLLEQALAIGRRALGPRARPRRAEPQQSRRAPARAGQPRPPPSRCSSRAWRCGGGCSATNDKDVAVTLVELARVLKDRGRGRGIRSADPRGAGDSPEDLRRRASRNGDEQERARRCCCGSAATWPAPSRSFARTSRRASACSAPIIRTPPPPKPASRQLLIAKGDAAGAEALLRESLAVHRRVFGDAHPEYALTLNNLANAVEAQGRLDEAQALFEEAVQHRAPAAERPASASRRHDAESRARPDRARPRRRDRAGAAPRAERAAAHSHGRRLAHRAGAEPARRVAAGPGALRGGRAADGRRRRRAEAAAGATEPRAPRQPRAAGHAVRKTGMSPNKPTPTADERRRVRRWWPGPAAGRATSIEVASIEQRSPPDQEIDCAWPAAPVSGR